MRADIVLVNVSSFARCTLSARRARTARVFCEVVPASRAASDKPSATPTARSPLPSLASLLLAACAATALAARACPAAASPSSNSDPRRGRARSVGVARALPTAPVTSSMRRSRRARQRRQRGIKYCKVRRRRRRTASSPASGWRRPRRRRHGRAHKKKWVGRLQAERCGEAGSQCSPQSSGVRSWVGDRQRGAKQWSAAGKIDGDKIVMDAHVEAGRRTTRRAYVRRYQEGVEMTRTKLGASPGVADRIRSGLHAVGAVRYGY